mmetsp:Transcript_18971/g.46586  ORF Transcript_18971/g.46586 Transcript_18971/m.46586 type:complete len:381 (+) Transcript_18971:301-1443(+)
MRKLRRLRVASNNCAPPILRLLRSLQPDVLVLLAGDDEEGLVDVREELRPSIRPDVDCVGRVALPDHLEEVRAVRPGDQPAEVQLPVDDPGLAGDRRPTVPVELGEEGPLAVDAGLGLLVVEPREVGQGGRVVGPALDPDGALGDRWEHLVVLDDLRRVLLHVHALEAGEGEHGGVDDVVPELLQAGLDVPAEVLDLNPGVLGEDLGLAAQGGGPDHGALGHLLDALVLLRDEDVAGIFAREVAREDGALREVGGDVLHRVHADVNLVEEELHVELLREEALPADLGEGDVEPLVPLGRDDVDGDRALLGEVREGLRQALLRLVRLGEGERGPAGADAERVRGAVRELLRPRPEVPVGARLAASHQVPHPRRGGGGGGGG